MFSGFVAGLLVGYISRQHLTFKNEVAIGDLINLFTGVVIALVLQNIVQKQFSNARVEKDLLIARIAAVDAALNEIHKLFLRKVEDFASVEVTAMQAMYKNFSNSIYMLEKALETCQPRIRGIDLEIIKPTRGTYRKRVLGGNFPSAPYDPQSIGGEEKLYRKMSLELQSMVFEVNSK